MSCHRLSRLVSFQSVDSLYRELRLVSASIKNSAAIDRAYETILNWCFYTILLVIGLAILGVDTLSLFISLSSILVAFAFMIGKFTSDG